MATRLVIGLLTLTVLGFLAPGSAYSQEVAVAIDTSGGLPTGPTGPEGEKLYATGFGGSIGMEILLPGIRFLVLRGFLKGSIAPTTGDTTLYLLSPGLGVALVATPSDAWNAMLTVSGGYALGIYLGKAGSSGFVDGGLYLNYHLGPVLSMGIGGGYHHVFRLHQSAYAGLKLTIHPSAVARRARVEIQDTILNPVFPVFYKHYDDHEIGRVVIENKENGTIRNVTTSFFVNQYMDEPKTCSVIPTLERGEKLEIPLYALFNTNVLAVTEGTKVAGKTAIAYEYQKRSLSVERTQTLQIHYRNAVTWDDDRRAASFVSAKDPNVMKYARSMAGAVREQQGGLSHLFFRQAMGVFESFALYGLSYQIDPNSSYLELSKDSFALDSVQFPSETLAFKGGDCDDLTVLYCALLESIGIPTAFITIPGHIFSAFSLELQPADAEKLFVSVEDIITVDGICWIPVETTMVNEGFLRAWQEGAREWREHTEGDTAKLYKVRDAWNEYQPTGILQVEEPIRIPDVTPVLERCQLAMSEYIQREIAPEVTQLEKQISENSDKPRYMNKLGVLYARYGLYEKARELFEQAADSGHPSSHINLGNLALLERRLLDAQESFRTALQMQPESVYALVGLARVSYELENYGLARELHSRVEQQAPELAAKISYVVSSREETARASDIVKRESMEWDEE